MNSIWLSKTGAHLQAVVRGSLLSFFPKKGTIEACLIFCPKVKNG